MTDNSAGLHEPAEKLSAGAIDRHRAIVSIMEELEAVDWYDQRVEAASDPELAAVLAHNRDEEKEHMAMTLEWLRRQDPALDEQLRRYLFTEGPVTEVEENADQPGYRTAGGETKPDPQNGSLGIGSLKGNPA
jgi:ferritin-like protein